MQEHPPVGEGQRCTKYPSTRTLDYLSCLWKNKNNIRKLNVNEDHVHSLIYPFKPLQENTHPTLSLSLLL